MDFSILWGFAVKNLKFTSYVLLFSEIFANLLGKNTTLLLLELTDKITF